MQRWCPQWAAMKAAGLGHSSQGSLVVHVVFLCEVDCNEPGDWHTWHDLCCMNVAAETQIALVRTVAALATTNHSHLRKARPLPWA